MAGNDDPFEQPEECNLFTNHSPFVTDPSMQPGYQVPGTNFQVPYQRFSGTNIQQLQAQQVAQGLYSIPPTPELQYDDLWANLEANLFTQDSLPQYDVAPGDFGLVEAYGYELPGQQDFTGSTPWNPATGVQQIPGPHSVIEGDDNTWAILSQALPDVGVDGSSSSGQAGLGSTSSGETGMPKDLQGFPSQQAHHEVAQTSKQGPYPLQTHEFAGTKMMDMVIEDSLSDGISSTEDPSWRGVPAATQIPHGYNVQNNNHNTSGSSVVTSAGGHISSENNFSIPHQQGLELRESYGGGSNFNGGAVGNEFTELIGPGLSAIRQLGEPRWALQLLNLCAAAVASENVTRTQHLMWVLNDLASVGGDVNQRFAAYGLRALYMRVTDQMEAIQTFLRPRHHDQEIHFGPKMVHRALVKFHEHVPWHQNCYSASSQTLLEVCAGKSRLHLIDIGAGKAIEWPIFIDALVSRPGGPPSILRITMIKDRRREEQNMQRANNAGNSEAADFMTRLVQFASVLGLHVEVNAVGKALECVTREDLRLRHGEILAVVCQFRLHRLSDEATEGSNPYLTPRDEFIDFLCHLNPHVFIMSDNDTEHCSQDFLTRFQSCMPWWWHFYESMDTGYAGRDTQERQIIEYEAGTMLLNMVACEGVARIERNEPYSRWSRRIQRAGFVPKDLSDEAKKVCQNLVNNHGAHWDVVFDSNCVLLRWRKEPMTFTSVWATPDHCSKNSCKCSMLHN